MPQSDWEDSQLNNIKSKIYKNTFVKSVNGWVAPVAYKQDDQYRAFATRVKLKQGLPLETKIKLVSMGKVLSELWTGQLDEAHWTAYDKVYWLSRSTEERTNEGIESGVHVLLGQPTHNIPEEEKKQAPASTNHQYARANSSLVTVLWALLNFKYPFE